MVRETEFYQRDIGSAFDAPRYLNQVEKAPNGNHLLPIVMKPNRSGCSFWLTIPEGFKAVVAVHGKYTGIWTAGVHWAPPWVTIPFLVSDAHFVYDTPVKECPTADNVIVTIDITLVVRVITEPGPNKKYQRLLSFVDNLGPKQLSPQLNAFQEEAVRDMARNRRYSEIYDLMDAQHDKQLENTRRMLNHHFGEYGIEVTEIAVTNVHFNKQSMADEMAQPAIYRQKDEFNKLEQEYQLKQITIKEKETKEKQLRKEDLEKFEATLQKNYETSQAELNKIRADTSKQLAEIREEERAQILRIQSESKLAVAKVKAKTAVELAKIKSQGSAEADAIQVETSTYIEKLKADAQRQIAENNAQCLGLKANAEQQAAVTLASKREYDAKFKHLRILKALADNPKLAIAGSNGDNVVAQLLANQQGATVLGVNA